MNPGASSTAVTTTTTNITPMQTLITFSKSLKPPAFARPSPPRLESTPKTIFALVASSKTGNMACSVTPQALISAEPTKKDHSRR